MKKIKALFNLTLFTLVSFVFFNGCFDKYLDKYTELPELTTKEVTSISYNSAVSGGNITSEGASDILERGVCWDTLPFPTIDDNQTYDGSGDGDFTSELSFLNDNTKYFVRAYASNIAGTAYGNEVTFTTKNGEFGSIEVFVRQESFAGPFVGGAVVNMYLTETDRTINNICATKNTSTENPYTTGALFEELVDQRYYFNAIYTTAQETWTGQGEIICIPGFKVQLEIVCKK